MRIRIAAVGPAPVGCSPIFENGSNRSARRAISSALRILGVLGPAGAALAPRLRELVEADGTDIPAAVAL
ncbi:hypothetical protein [Streptomyces aureus]|uniref:hypothetical protein n=1 Tax=Streptomyces aureus TaxID=193461 RepID=UPI0036C7D3DC